MELETRYTQAAQAEIRATTEAKSANGYAAVFNSDSHDLGGFIERIAPGAFARTLERANAHEHNIHALWSHDHSQPLGSTRSAKLKLSEDAHGLGFTLDTTYLSDAQRGLIADGDLQMSFGFRVRDEEWRNEDDGTITRTLKEVDLSEISFVIFPAYPATDAAIRSLAEWRSNNPNIIKAIDVSALLKRNLAQRAKLKGR